MLVVPKKKDDRGHQNDHLVSQCEETSRAPAEAKSTEQHQLQWSNVNRTRTLE